MMNPMPSYDSLSAKKYEEVLSQKVNVGKYRVRSWSYEKLIWRDRDYAEYLAREGEWLPPGLREALAWGIENLKPIGQ